MIINEINNAINDFMFKFQFILRNVFAHLRYLERDRWVDFSVDVIPKQVQAFVAGDHSLAVDFTLFVRPFTAAAWAAAAATMALWAANAGIMVK